MNCDQDHNNVHRIQNLLETYFAYTFQDSVEIVQSQE